MKPVDCPREHEVVRLILSRRWPDCADEELRAHAGSCPSCSEVAAVATLLGSERDESLREVQIPAAGQVWWRAALRAHAEAAEAARRPLVWLLGIAVACAVGVGAAVVTLAWPSINGAVSAVAALPATLGPEVAPLLERLRPVIQVALGVLALLVLTPLAVYFALSDD